MATQTIQFAFLTGQAVTVRLFAESDLTTALATPTATEQTALGCYQFTQTDRAAGRYIVTVTATGINAVYSLVLRLADATFWARLMTDADVNQFGGVNGTFTSGRPEVNATQWGGTAVASANVLIDGAITPAKIGANALNGKGDWGTALSLGALSETVGEAGSGLTDVTTQVVAALAAAHGAGSWETATGFSTLTASDVRNAIGLATNNLDTQLGLLATSSALAALVNTVGVAGAGLTEAGGTGDQFTALPRVGVTLRYTQVAANSGGKTADVSIGAAT